MVSMDEDRDAPSTERRVDTGGSFVPVVTTTTRQGAPGGADDVQEDED